MFGFGFFGCLHNCVLKRFGSSSLTSYFTITCNPSKCMPLTTVTYFVHRISISARGSDSRKLSLDNVRVSSKFQLIRSRMIQYSVC